MYINNYCSTVLGHMLNLQEPHQHDVDDAGAYEHEVKLPSNLVESYWSGYECNLAGEIECGDTESYTLRSQVVGKDLSNVNVLCASEVLAVVDQSAGTSHLRIEEEAPPEDVKEDKEHCSSQPRYVISIEKSSCQGTQADDACCAACATDE